ncbi:hypothetical protein GCM10018781_67860 [Kitasatospora indigofera]|uniref:Uncharacterized protein n=1 Tax=Kitasatospora indigofera TaxID=67307 RepID=A0A919L4P9_9ACTN|nr:hypothetical protein GCM10018781_67860 [Kitasatospora indigofera]
MIFHLHQEAAVRPPPVSRRRARYHWDTTSGPVDRVPVPFGVSVRRGGIRAMNAESIGRPAESVRDRADRSPEVDPLLPAPVVAGPVPAAARERTVGVDGATPGTVLMPAATAARTRTAA